MNEKAREIRGDAKSVRALLGGTKYAVDYYQREYKWKKENILELLTDLTNKFLEDYDPSDERTAVQRYGHYFLGSIIISHRDGQRFIIDGQQRLTSLTLLLIHLHHILKEEEQKRQLVELIFSQSFGRKSFNLDVPERTPCLDALYRGQTYDDSTQSESIKNILARYQDLQENLSPDLTGNALPYFVDWLIENVHLVEITAYTDEDAYTIFETMNDRGLRLSLTEMLKGYLLANIQDTKTRERTSEVWKERIRALRELDEEADEQAIASWLRSQYAESIRERKKGAVARDFDLIGTQFHRWVQSHEAILGLDKPGGFASFIEKDFKFYARQYELLLRAAEKPLPGLETIFYNAKREFTLQYPVILAPLRVTDDEHEVRRKIRVVGTYLDILIARRTWNWRAIDYSTMQYAMFLVMKEIRGKGALEVAEVLTNRLESDSETFSTNDNFYLTGTNGRKIHHILARLTDFVETSSGRPSRFADYIQRKGKGGYEIEHIWADHPERHTDEFVHASDFAAARNRIGGLLLLPKSFNASYGDEPYETKLEHYYGQNLLAASLHPRAYERDPGFHRFMESSGLPFKSHASFRKSDQDARSLLYRKIAEQVWNPARLMEATKSG